MTDKYKIELCLKLFKNKEVTLSYTVNYILDVFTNSKKFNEFK